MLPKRKEAIQEKINASSGTSVDLGEMDINDDEVEEIAKYIKGKRPNVQRIFLNNNHISDNGVVILAEIFTGLPNLKSIDLQFNNIDKPGAAAIISLKLNHPDINIPLRGNKIDDAAEMENIEKNVTANRFKS